MSPVAMPVAGRVIEDDAGLGRPAAAPPEAESLSADHDPTGRLIHLERRDWHLWALALLVILGLTVAVIGVLFPQILGADGPLSSQLRVHVAGLSILVLLFCAHVIQTVREMRTLRRRLSTSEHRRTKDHALLDLVRERTARLQASETNHRNLLQWSADAIILVDANNVVRYLNPAAEVLFGRPAGDLLDQAFEFATAETDATEIRIARPDGVTTIAEMRVISTLWKGERAHLASVRDITTRKHAEDILKQANDKLRRLDQLKSNFISTVSHELRTPLTSIKNAVHIMLSGKAGATTEPQDKFLRMALRNIDRLSRVVNDVLDLSRLESGRVEFRFADVDLLPVIDHVVATFGAQAESSALTLHADVPSALPPVYGDEARLEQILCNLIGNAMKFTPAGGRVTVGARRQADSIVVEVADTGIGMSEEDQRRIFERFYQAGDPLTRPTTGTGLGLAIVREMVQAQGGRIWLRSELGRGSRFFFEIPISSERSKEIASFEHEFQRNRDRDTVSIMMIELDGPDRSTLTKEQAEALRIRLGRLKERLGACLRKPSDTIGVHPASGRLLVMMPETPKWGALTVRDNLARTLVEIATEDPQGWPVVPAIVGPATFPEDGTTGRELMEHALGSERQRRRRDDQAEDSACG